MSDGTPKEDPLKRPTVTTRPGQADDMVKRGGTAATGVESPALMRREQKNARGLPKHTIIDKGQSKG